METTFLPSNNGGFVFLDNPVLIFLMFYFLLVVLIRVFFNRKPPELFFLLISLFFGFSLLLSNRFSFNASVLFQLSVLIGGSIIQFKGKQEDPLKFSLKLLLGISLFSLDNYLFNVIGLFVLSSEIEPSTVDPWNRLIGFFFKSILVFSVMTLLFSEGRFDLSSIQKAIQAKNFLSSIFSFLLLYGPLKALVLITKNKNLMNEKAGKSEVWLLLGVYLPFYLQLMGKINYKNIITDKQCLIVLVILAVLAFMSLIKIEASSDRLHRLSLMMISNMLVILICLFSQINYSSLEIMVYLNLGVLGFSLKAESWDGLPDERLSMVSMFANVFFTFMFLFIPLAPQVSIPLALLDFAAREIEISMLILGLIFFGVRIRQDILFVLDLFSRKLPSRLKPT